MSNRISVSLFLIAAFAIVAVAGRSAAQGGATAPQNVLVTNSTSQPVPVKAATSFPVDLVNTANVHAFVTNSSTSPVPTSRSEDKNIYRQVFSLDIIDGAYYATVSFSVPSGKRLVVDFVSAMVASATNPADVLQVQANNGSLVGAFCMPMPTLPNNATASGASSFCHLTIEPGETMEVFLERPFGATSGLCHGLATIEGHFVTVP